MDQRCGCSIQMEPQAHTVGATMDLLRPVFGERLISKRAEIEYPARSPDLTAP